MQIKNKVVYKTKQKFTDFWANMIPAKAIIRHR